MFMASSMYSLQRTTEKIFSPSRSFSLPYFFFTHRYGLPKIRIYNMEIVHLSLCQKFIFLLGSHLYLGDFFWFFRWFWFAVQVVVVVLVDVVVVVLDVVVVVGVFYGLEQPALFAISRFANHCCIFIYLHKIFGVWIGSFINKIKIILNKRIWSKSLY